MTSDPEEVRITLRMPSDVRDRLSQAASSSGRSLNGEIVFRLQSSFEFDRQTLSINEERSMMLEALERQELLYENLRGLIADAAKRKAED